MPERHRRLALFRLIPPYFALFLPLPEHPGRAGAAVWPYSGLIPALFGLILAFFQLGWPPRRGTTWLPDRAL